jgi:flagellar protein FliJ
MFKYRFNAILQLRENERDAARGLVAEAFEALRQIDVRRQELRAERASLDDVSGQRRTGVLSMDRLLSDGRYERQLAAEDAQMAAASQKIELELQRRQQALANANAAVRQMEILREKEAASWEAHQAKLSQANLDEIAARRQQTNTRPSFTDSIDQPKGATEVQSARVTNNPRTTNWSKQ